MRSKIKTRKVLCKIGIWVIHTFNPEYSYSRKDIGTYESHSEFLKYIDDFLNQEKRFSSQTIIKQSPAKWLIHRVQESYYEPIKAFFLFELL